MTLWLTTEQQKSWRAYIAASELLTDRLSRELQAAHGITLADYEIFVRLSESDGRRMRMSHLADATLSSRSRLSHQIDRLESAGLVVREPCEDDRRGANAVLTDAGFGLLVAAAPMHVAGVREHLVDLLTHEQFAALGSACTVVVDHLQSADCPQIA